MFVDFQEVKLVKAMTTDASLTYASKQDDDDDDELMTSSTGYEYVMTHVIAGRSAAAAAAGGPASDFDEVCARWRDYVYSL